MSEFLSYGTDYAKFLSQLHQVLTDVQNSFTVTLSKKFAKFVNTLMGGGVV